MTFLEKIIQTKKAEVSERLQERPVSLLEQSVDFGLPGISLTAHLCEKQGSGIIAEFKRRSPSRGAINESVTVKEVTRGYVKAGAIGLSVLTDTPYFGGSSADLHEARRNNMVPILRKDFIIDEYQVFEAKAIGADVILLIAECLSAKAIKQLAKRAHDLGLQVLLEMHSDSQLDKICPEVDVIGINNRDLHRFETNLETSFRMIEAIPKNRCCISESGITRPEEALALQEAGFKGFLMGTRFMNTEEPALACAEFIQQLDQLTAGKLQTQKP
ncbi:MAG: indole-3-glycerol phosphate synthase TrpC [Bacteroidetes bacterium]|nr:indole-3-glycerol phosphate synthase TrpC [Bacteroidota bacterium]